MTGKITTAPLWTQAWSLILTAAGSSDHPFSTPVLGSIHHGNVPRLRTVVLREADREGATLRCYADIRSLKINDLRENSTLSWLFWDPTEKVQVSCSGPGRCLTGEAVVAIFEKIPKHGRKAYATRQAPGTFSSQKTSGLPEDWPDLQPEETDYARENFAVVETRIDRMDVLQLGREGNHRLTARRDGEAWQLQWVVP